MQWNQQALVASSQPLWVQIAERLRHEIEFGGFKQGDLLPSEAALNEAFGVSRTTARSALDKLEQEGLISRRAGKGSVVLPPQVIQPLSQMSSFAEDMRRRGFTASYKTLSARMVTPPAEVAAALQLVENEKAYAISRLLNADGQPMALVYSWLKPGLFDQHAPPSIANLDRESLYAWLEQHCNCRIAGAQETIGAALANAELARRLKVAKGSASLVARRLSHDEQKQPVEYAVVHYRADRYSFAIELVRS
ncbi:GntR family transcriptional regulator [Rouxiella silvae]|uniref:GntR family transcriptional regulator n=1 Tax=Rouxiella silvae TaxID=1646373 RepID=A0AA40X218_9GAMM|nr:GntR family transcriptional regulator [Rouxiella silvae]MBF6637014.1 GntR family transcriptional regulator [Rouxiella silvae]